MSQPHVSTPATSLEKVKGLPRGATIFTFLLGIFMGALDHGIVGPALSSILAEYRVTANWGVWIFTIYTLLFAVSIPILGKLSDRFGRKRTYTFGIAMFASGSIIAAISPNFIVFLIGRAVQAVGTGGIFPITAAQIAVSYPPESRGRMLGLIGMVFGLGSILGPILGGVMIELADWKWIFLINVPISLVILLLVAAIRQEQPVVKKPIDYAGLTLLTAIILLVMLGITNKSLIFLAAGLILVPLLVIAERRTEDPVMNIRYFTQFSTLSLLLASMISGFIMASITNLIPYFAETVMGLEKGAAGMSVTPLAVASVAASLIGGYMVDKAGAIRVLMLGFAITFAAGLTMASGVDAPAVFYPVIAVMGFGIGIIIGAPLNMLILQAVNPKEAGSAIGYISLFRSLGSSMGPTVAGLLFSMYTNGFVRLFAISAVVSAGALILLVLFRRGIRVAQA